MATWPDEVKIMREGYGEKPPQRVIRSETDVGPGKIRRRSTNAVRPVTLNLSLTPVDFETFDAFYLANDALAFDFPDPRSGTNVRARFTSEPDYKFTQTRWSVSVSLEILP